MMPSRTAPLVLSLSLAACAGANTPHDAVRAYRDALASGNETAALAAISPSSREAMSPTRFASEFERRREAGAPLLDLLDKAARSDAQLTATLDYSDYERVSLALIDGQWRVTAGFADFDDQSTPRATALGFIRAVEVGDAVALLRLMPSAYRSQTDENTVSTWLVERADMLAETVALLRQSVNGTIVENGDEASLRYGAHEMRFARESAVWVIADFD
jgi:hypothetical protein